MINNKADINLPKDPPTLNSRDKEADSHPDIPTSNTHLQGGEHAVWLPRLPYLSIFIEPYLPDD